MMKIPKIIHQVWIGPNKPPEFLGSWRDKHPDYQWILWDNKAVKNIMPLYNQKLFDDCANKAKKNGAYMAGLSDILRYEILYKYGGIYIDADIDCLRTLEGDFLERELFIPYVLDKIENVLSIAVIGCTPKHPIINNMIERLHQHKKMKDTPNRLTGSIAFTDEIDKSDCEVCKLPTYYFNPVHYSGAKYQGSFQPFGDHKWMTARKLFETDQNS